MGASGAAVDHLNLIGMPCHDLRVPDELDHSGYAAHRIRVLLDSAARPDVVLSDELCLAPLVCRAMGVPCVLVVCSFRHYRESPAAVPAFAAATRILLATWAEVDEIPHALRHKVTAIGPIVRGERHDRSAARTVLGLPADAFVVTASFGSLNSAKRAYFAAALTTVILAWRHAAESDVLVIPLSEETVRDLTGLTPTAGIAARGRLRT